MDKKGRIISLTILFLILGFLLYFGFSQVFSSLGDEYIIGISAIIDIILITYISKKF